MLLFWLRVVGSRKLQEVMAVGKEVIDFGVSGSITWDAWVAEAEGSCRFISSLGLVRF